MHRKQATSNYQRAAMSRRADGAASHGRAASLTQFLQENQKDRRGPEASTNGETETDHRAAGGVPGFLVTRGTDMVNNKTYLSCWPALVEIRGAGHRIRRGVCGWGDLSRGQFCAQYPNSQKCSHSFGPNKAVLGDPKKIYMSNRRTTGTKWCLQI